LSRAGSKVCTENIKDLRWHDTAERRHRIVIALSRAGNKVCAESIKDLRWRDTADVESRISGRPVFIT
jgi:hypothetical protein